MGHRARDRLTIPRYSVKEVHGLAAAVFTCAPASRVFHIISPPLPSAHITARILSLSPVAHSTPWPRPSCDLSIDLTH
jgi:hypothetical protein